MASELTTIEKILALLDEGILEFHDKDGELYIGLEHVPRNRKLTVAEINNMYTQSLGRNAINHPNYVAPEEVISEMTDYLARERLARTQARIESGNLFNNATEFVNYWLGQWKINIRDNRLIEMDTMYALGTDESDIQTVDINSLISMLKIKLSEYNAQEDTPPFNRDDIQHILAVALLTMQKSKVAALKNTLKYRGTYSHDELVRWARGLLNVYYVGREDVYNADDVDVYMFLHMLWQIKRKIFLKPVDSEVVYSFYSIEQGLGKTSLIRDICAPFRFGYGTVPVTDMLDINNRIALCENKYVVDMIELAKTRVSDSRGPQEVAAMFKSLVGNNNDDIATTSVRQFHTQKQMTIEQSTTFVATTNMRINTVVTDSDMRRFWEFNFNAPKGWDSERWMLSQPFTEDIVNIFQSINEGDRFGYYHPNHPLYLDIYKKCRVIQKNMAKGNAFTDWVDLYQLELSDVLEDGFVRMDLHTLKRRFTRIKDKEGIDTRIFTQFYIESVLKSSYGIEPLIERDGNNVTKYIYIKGAL